MRTLLEVILYTIVLGYLDETGCTTLDDAMMAIITKLAMHCEPNIFLILSNPKFCNESRKSFSVL